MRAFWTDNEREILVALFPDTYTKEICKVLNRSYSSVAGHASMLKLKKSKAFMSMELKKQAERLKKEGVKHLYKKGRTPENKGKKMPDEVYAKVKHTMFKKGNTPHNTKYNGHERLTVDGYWEIRVRKGKYALKHRLLWEKEVGKIPKNRILVFKDKNANNITIENIELITREENMLRNTIHRYPPELKSTIKLVKKLKRKIDEKQNRRLA